MADSRAESTSNDWFGFSADRKTIGRSAVHSILMQVIVRLKGLITMPIMTYYLSPRELGTFTIILATSAMLAPVFSLNLTDGPAIHFVQEASQQKIRVMYNTVTNGILLSCLACTLIFCLVMSLIGGGKDGYMGFILVLLYSTILHKVVTFVLAIFQKTSLLVNNTLCRDGVAAILGVCLVVAGYSYAGIVAATVAANVLAAGLVYRITRSQLPYSPRINGAVLRQFLATSLPLLPVFFFSWVVQSSDSYFLAYYQGQEAVGKYAVIYGISGVILSLTYALNFFWFPMSAKLWVENREKYRLAFTRVFAAMVVVLFLVTVLFELNSRWLVTLLVSRRAYHNAYGITGIIAFAFSMQVLITLLTAPLYANRNTRAIFSAYLCGGIANTLLNLALIPGSGIVGAAVSTALSYGVIVLALSWMNYSLARFHFLDRRLLPVALLFFIAWAGTVWLRASLHPFQLIIITAVLSAATFGFVYTRGMNRMEKDYCRDMLAGLRLKLGRS